ncbi:MAG: hypothetical protein MJ138_08390 [Kiritimatiellae bacterium]|nr:hypothetical protein [Kiritimatiellia bacterium]
MAARESAHSRWDVVSSGRAIEWRVASDSRLPHRDWMEMSGRKASLLFDYTVSSNRTLALARRVVWPCVRTQPNNTHASLGFDFPANGIPRLTADGEIVDEKVSRISFDGVWTSVGTTESGLVVERRVFPSSTAPAVFECWRVTNGGKRSVAVGVTRAEASWIRLGCTGRFVVSAAADRPETVALAPGRSAELALAFAVRRADERPRAFNAAEEEASRLARVLQLTDRVRLETDDPALDAAFRFAKIRAGESVYETAGGVMHSPGGGAYYAGTWCNDQVEYAGPWFAMTGDELLLEASMNAYRQYVPFMADDYAPIPSSVIAEGRDYWNGAGDRGDAAMWAYGASRFVLTAGRRDWADELRPGIRWTLEYCRRKLAADGVVASDTDELEGRLPSGKANLNTSSLCYDALRKAAIVERAFGDEKTAADYEARAVRLRDAIERHFGAELHGFKTYRYYEGCKVLRSWIGSPLCVGIFDRAQDTAGALLSPHLRTRNAGLLSAEGDPSGVTWDRSQLYAFRGIFAAGLGDRAWDDFVAYSRTRLLGEHVPYPVEAWPEGDMRHLSAESALYCRVVTEGLFGLEPTGFGTFRANARLPKGLKRMALRNVHAFGRVFDVEVDEKGVRIKECGKD